MKYFVEGVLTVSIFTEVEADSKEAAIEEAALRSVQGLCHQCSGGDAKSEWSLTGELDGEPMEFKAEEA